MTYDINDLIETLILCIEEDGLSWAEAFTQFREQTGWSSRSSMDVGRRFQAAQLAREARSSAAVKT